MGYLKKYDDEVFIISKRSRTLNYLLKKKVSRNTVFI